jgi:hypothetical protein
MLAVGVSRDKHTPPDDLTYAARDAEDIANAFPTRERSRIVRTLGHAVGPDGTVSVLREALPLAQVLFDPPLLLDEIFRFMPHTLVQSRR